MSAARRISSVNGKSPIKNMNMDDGCKMQRAFACTYCEDVKMAVSVGFTERYFHDYSAFYLY